MKLIRMILLAAAALVGAGAQTQAALQGVDVYSGQGTINWATAKSAGMRFAFVKATEGVDFVDSKFTANMNAAIAAGIPVGPYHFARTNSGESTVQDPTPNPDAVAEANDFCDAIQSYYSGPGLVLRPVLDMEQLPDGPIAPFTNKTYISKWSKDFSNVVKTRIGVTPIIYLNGNFAINYMDSSFSTYPLWFAKPITPTPNDSTDTAFQNNMNNVSPPTDAQMGIWSSYAFWQWSWEGAVSGISGNVDRDYFPGTMQQLAEQYVVGWLPGDFNGDNKVDTLDYVKWRDTKGQTVNFGLGADGDLSGVIDLTDYNIWLSHFGTSSSQNDAGAGGAALATGAPEPGTLVLGLIMAVFLAAKKRFAHRQAVRP